MKHKQSRFGTDEIFITREGNLYLEKDFTFPDDPTSDKLDKPLTFERSWALGKCYTIFFDQVPKEPRGRMECSKCVNYNEKQHSGECCVWQIIRRYV